MLEIVHGKPQSPGAIAAIVGQLRHASVSGTLYMGYPVLSTVDENVILEAMLVSPQHGVVMFAPEPMPPSPGLAESWSQVSERQDRIFFALKNHLSRFPSLRRGRELAVPLEVVTVFPEDVVTPEHVSIRVAGPAKLAETVKSLQGIAPEYIQPLNAALQCITNIRPAKKREGVLKANSRGAILKIIEKEIANLDQWQKKAALECPEGPQRIRGLAGSGKTITLALKAAYLHARYPEWDIALTFFTRSLYQQFIELVRRFFREHCADDPNFDKLRIVHAWGSASRSGLYSEFAGLLGHPVRDFVYAKSVFGRDKSFAGVCGELLARAESLPVKPAYDAVLIDEAQDLPPEFFKLAYLFAKEPKRIVFAYDEMQNLTDPAGMAPVNDLFGRKPDGNPRVVLDEAEGEARTDVILPVCYRNTPWALTIAHALGFGIYRKKGLVQHFDHLDLWTQIGYTVTAGHLAPGAEVTLRRRPDSAPKFFRTHLTSDDAVTLVTARDGTHQSELVSREIEKNLRDDELEHDDILVVLPYALTARRAAQPIVAALARRGIPAHLVGATSSQDEVFRRGSVAVTHIFRAKGNEAPMVYVLNCQDCAHGHELSLTRNILFTAITRSRAWVRLMGYGPGMDAIAEEIDAVRHNEFQLKFKVPTADEVARMRRIHRDLSESERARIRRHEKQLNELVEAVEKGDLMPENLPPELLEKLQAIVQKSQGESDEG